tara:strand:+ start:603 stop:953 length:351 start_codon:yes stop_codon:yes gene_type:complete
MENFVERLQKILKDKNLTASQFAKKINVQRSSVSHVLGKRNKPSLDFIIKITDKFEDISLDWLINGDINKDVNVNFESSTLPPLRPSSIANNNSNKKKIMKVICFYTDNSFDVFKN